MSRKYQPGIAFGLPATRLVRVKWIKDGVQYVSIIQNPKSNTGLQAAMLAKHVGLSQVQRVEGVL